MYVQLAWGRARPGAWDNLREFYVDKVIPFTMGMPGQQERQLWRGASDPDEMGFWSVWASLQELRNYETSDARRQLASQAEDFFYPMAYPRGETWIKHFEIVSSSGEGTAEGAFLMMAWGKLRLGSWDQYEDYYRSQVEQTTTSVDGLRKRLLLRSTEDPDEGLSLSVWESEEALLRYERSDIRRNMAQEVENLYRGEFWVKHFEVTDTNQ
ncbi:hypothetical protein GBAR_LOCUS8744 [Geodia barretti]|uniref:ABM domain-containing protein n=1 Tax=Geodia barretti TaxID=519541 RepID=A0AA35RNU9_GEOBA|nr:hypothetical protein GBAR_LOCUS8744 [Geodia barretti]